MSLIINNNISALNTHRNLNGSSTGMSKAIEKLSSGYRINVGADDPSGLIISEQLRSQISGLERAVRNSSEASNLIGIAEGALNEMNTILKKMRALAIHACNSGVTSPEQVAADQAELDSGIQTLDRIANTTRYSDQYLLNGSKELVYDRNTTVNEPNDHPLLDTSLTRVDQIFKRDGVKMTIGYTGDKSPYQANTSTSAQRAYLEADNANGLCQINGNKTTNKQEFILTGSGGSRLFSFAEGAHLGDIVQSINNVRDSTGIGATLTFASDVRVDRTSYAVGKGGHGPNYNAADPADRNATRMTGFTDGTYVYHAGDVQIYGAGLNNPATAAITDFCITPDAADAFKVGFNCDGDGKIYAKVIDKSTNSIEYYKDKECTMMIGKGSSDFFAATNNAGIPSSPTETLDGIFMTLSPNAQDLDVYEIALLGQDLDNMKDMNVDIQGWADTNNSTMSGVNLGYNTSPEGDLFYRYTPVTFESDGAGGKVVKTFKVEVFKDSSMEPKYLVAKSGEMPAQVNAENADPTLNPPYSGQTVRLESVLMDNGLDSGLNMTLVLPKEGLTYTGDQTARNKLLPSGEQTGSLSCTNLGLRIDSTDYGSQESIRIQNKECELFYQFRDSDTMEHTMVKAGTTVQVNGQDAQISINGAPIYTTGLVANTTTPDFSGSIVFNSGSLGKTTVAITGYEDGKLYSRSTSLQGIEENEIEITQQRRTFEPPSLTMRMGNQGANGLLDKTGKPINMYLDFSQLDPTVEVMVNQLAPNRSIQMTYTYDAANGPQLTINCASLSDGTSPMTVTMAVSPEKLKEGFYITDPALKGLYIKSDNQIDLNQSQKTPPTSDYGPMEGFIESQGGDPMREVYTYATNPRKTTTESLYNFLGGMQFQLGNTEGDQDRTIYSIQSMSMSNMGRITYNGKDYCLQDVLGGGVASLSKDPILAMNIIGQAVDDVSGLRARLGAFQSNMLETNINSLNVAIENITKTESAIRDTDMAAESTQFTRFQVMQQAGTSMLAQANQVSQNVLSLLQ
ncbi:MAG: hypothetical protein LIP23_03095 [Planctomycetes bacterium]|nr:hypothetical protein [Planctomycetota bacterium]